MGSPWTLYPQHADSSLVTSQFHFHNCLVAPPAKIQRLECRYEVSSVEGGSAAAAAYFPSSSNLNLHNSNGGSEGPHPHIPDDLPPLNYIGTGAAGGTGGGGEMYPRVTSNNSPAHNTTTNGSRKREHFRLGMGVVPTPPVPPESTGKSLSGPYVIRLREIPTWSIYYNDQKHRLLHFTDNDNPVKPDDFLNRSVSLCFDEVCITDIAADAIVTSSTASYGGMYGVDKKIHDRAGKGLKEVCRTLPELGVGEAEITPGFLLPAKHVIHTNGPDSDDQELLKKCYENCLDRLVENDGRTIVFPCIGTGKKGITRRLAATTALGTVRTFLERNRHKVDRVVFSLHNPKDVVIYRRFMQVYFPLNISEVDES